MSFDLESKMVPNIHKHKLLCLSFLKQAKIKGRTIILPYPDPPSKTQKETLVSIKANRKELTIKTAASVLITRAFF